MQKFSKWNDGVKYLLMVIDVFGKYVWIKPLKDKKTETVTKTFDETFKTSKRKPKMLWTDKGFESNYIALRLKRYQELLRDGIEQWKIECGGC